MPIERDSEVLIGCTGFSPHGRRALTQAGLMELQESFVTPPKLATAKRWREEAPDGFVFSIRCWQAVTHGPESAVWSRVSKRHQLQGTDCGFFRKTECVQMAYEMMLPIVAALEARVLLFDTPASFTPTRHNRQALRDFFGTCSRPAGVAFAWQPRGVWTGPEIEAVCREVDLLPAVDPVALDWWPTGEEAYVRLGAARYSEAELGTIAERLMAYDTAYCVITSPSPFEQIQRLMGECALVET
jgi:uncharacterized protein YecE (DUF72 family)